jgi:hypothetical protein
MPAAFHPVLAELTTVQLAACPDEDRMYASTELLVSLLMLPLVPSTHGLFVALISPEPDEGSGSPTIYNREPALVGVRVGVLIGVVPVVGLAFAVLSKVHVPPV